MLQWIPSEDTFSFAVHRSQSVQSPFPFIIFSLLFYLFFSRSLFPFLLFFFSPVTRNDIDAQLRGYRDESQAPAAEEKAY